MSCQHEQTKFCAAQGGGQGGPSGGTHQTKRPAIIAIDYGIVGAKKDDLENENDEAEYYLHRVQAQLRAGHIIGVELHVGESALLRGGVEEIDQAVTHTLSLSLCAGSRWIAGDTRE
jgi:hypothetical protein